MPGTHPIRCRCGQLQAEVSRPGRATHVVCYCRDCQAFAHFLGSPRDVLDEFGGTDITAIRPRDLAFTRGLEHLACMSLTAKGTLRWYAGCCRTPIGNTLRDIRFSHLGLIHNCLEGAGVAVDASFGPVTLRVNRHSAKGEPPATPSIAYATNMVRYVGSLAWSRISGKYRENPFFDAGTGRPCREPKVLTAVEYRQVMDSL